MKNLPETQERLEFAGLDFMDYDRRWRRYRTRLQTGEIEKNKAILTEVIAEAYKASNQD